MRLSIKMYLIIFISASVILYQYHLSNAWLISQNSQEFHVLNPKTNEKLRNVSLFNITSSISNSTRPTTPCFQELEDVLPPLYVITPTYRRPEQLAELTRLSHTLMLVKNVFWIVVEDATSKTPLVGELLKKTGLKYEHLIAPMPEQYRKKKKGPKPRGVSNRNRGLQWIRQNAKTGVLYFADDDNTYDLQLFAEIRYTKRVSMFPVGLITKLGVSSPIVRNGRFSGFYDGWVAGRKFPVDMAGFAVSVEFLLKRPKALMPFKPGFEEDGFLKSLEPFEPQDIELLASNCTKILVWHTQTKKNEPSQPLDFAKYNNTNLVMLKQILV
ncbi:galactosylgalactosylxylosylprotein 3-beta-glucuronosyltransferase P-like [Tribolium madens]|uniref:galactosylgalactosylxylosylprotein 3-beta-glucuronosyltransferase P-like n=1 Tax=Tribolium madens TaxID=41895 RepID=UPI001CF75A40|nr:galactosylgalactosylxylosylprotein 3-beta-glucuronosyltransferase P-like [Tribolium madens]XP_044256481.1 galactosylgalactosylxylosylprotein 3-beta-glucuronosyltransferase P-like [Tribolium madens]XP_044256482.1 galactosylgalactosylxylosylprotein 3-beta-glucuronosyltransferase P-like [Tribolium madens]